MREALSLSAQLGLPFMIHLIEMHLAQVLAKQPAADKRDEARRIACAYLEQKDMGLAWLAEPNAVMAVLETEAGNLDSASVHIQKAIDGFEGLPASRLANMALQVELMLRQGQVAAARQVAEEAHRQLMQQGGLGARELPVRLAVLQARHADGDIDGARRAASDALDAVRLRANFVADLEVRRNFLNTSECSRILELAQLVLGTVEEI